jgi:hypothetical protein
MQALYRLFFFNLAIDFLNYLCIIASMTNSDIKTQVTKNIITAIKYCGNQNALAQRSGLTQGVISKYKRGYITPTYITAQKLSKAVDMTQPISDFAPYVLND